MSLFLIPALKFLPSRLHFTVLDESLRGQRRAFVGGFQYSNQSQCDIEVSKIQLEVQIHHVLQNAARTEK